MKRYSQERKEAILQKMAPPQSMTVAEVARQEGISTATLYNWRKVARERGAVLPSRSSAPGQWSSEDKFRVVLETVSLSEAEFSEYCRSNGLLPEWVEAWRRACMGANASEEDRQRQVRHAGKAERQQIKKLKAELRYKDKALAATFLETLYDLGIAPSRSRPRVSNDNAYSEALFRTLKYRPGFPAEGFATLEQARQWVLQFTQWYNNEHRHSALNYVTPAQRHNGEAKSVLIARQKVLNQVKTVRPERWSGAIRDLSLPGAVTLNPERAANC